MQFTMLEAPEQAVQQFASVRSAAEDLQKDVEHLLGLLAPGAGDSTLTHVQRAQALLALAQAAAALSTLHAQCSGQAEPQGMQKERDRLEAYTKKVNKAVAAEELRNARPLAQLNVAAMNRFIDHAISENLTEEQRQQLRQPPPQQGSADEDSVPARPSKAARTAQGRAAAARGKPGQAKDHAVAFLQQIKDELTNKPADGPAGGS